MTLPRLAAKFLTLALVLLAATALRLWVRERRAVRDVRATGRFITVGGRRVHVHVEGNGPDLILIHGASGNLRDFTFDLATDLAKRFRVICLDRPGFGFSDPLPNDEMTLKDQAAHLRQAALQLGANNPVLCGQSYGGSVALAWALDHPPAALLLLSAPSLPWPGDLDPWYRWNRHPALRAILLPLACAWVPMAYVEKAIEGIFAPNSTPLGYADHIGRGLSLRIRTLSINVRQINALRGQLVEMEPRYPSLSLPIELVHGTQDTIVPLHIHSAELAPRLSSATLTVLEGTGHMPHHAQKDQVMAIISRAAARAGLL